MLTPLVAYLWARKWVADGRWQALTRRPRLFVDVEQELLAEPAFTQVCKDELSAKVYRERRQAPERQLPVLASSILLASGTRILWDGQPWRILNVGGTDIYLEDEGKAISALSLDSFQSLVANGVISGIPSQADQKHALADQVMRKAAPVDLEKAISRAEALKAGTAARVPARTLRYWRKRAEEGELAYGKSLFNRWPSPWMSSARSSLRIHTPGEHSRSWKWLWA